MKIGPEQSLQMPMKTVISLIVMVALGTVGFFQIQEKLNQHSTKIEIMERDLVMNSEFRIKWPRGLLGSLPADSEQFMLIEELYKEFKYKTVNSKMTLQKLANRSIYLYSIDDDYRKKIDNSVILSVSGSGF